jgi:HAD superfamily hydrolase (TIGR01549 family)
MCQLIADYLKLSENEKVKNIADSISQKQAYFLKRNSRSLFLLKRNHKLGIVSNFSGNLELILAEFSLNEYFDFVLDSYHVGLEKPSLDFFKIALTKAKAIEKSILFVGDNLDRDIRPAKKLGLQTVLINPTLKKSIADFTLHSIEVLPNIF